MILQGIMILVTIHNCQHILGSHNHGKENEYLGGGGRESYKNPPHQDDLNYHNPALKEMEYLSKLDTKILHKIAKKKFLLDGFLALWLQILEKKKEFLFKIWAKKKSKKTNEEDFNAQNFHIPYYYENSSDEY